RLSPFPGARSQMPMPKVLPLGPVCPSVNSTDEAASRPNRCPPCGSGHSGDSRGARSPDLGDLADRRGLICAANRVGFAIANLLDHRGVQERAVARSRAVSEAAGGWPRLVDVEGWHADDAGALADRCLVRIGGNASHVLRSALKGDPYADVLASCDRARGVGAGCPRRRYWPSLRRRLVGVWCRVLVIEDV